MKANAEHPNQGLHSRQNQVYGESHTLINNVETFAAIAPIINNGGEWYSEIGTPKSAGTKVFALAGKINNAGLIEVADGYHSS